MTDVVQQSILEYIERPEFLKTYPYYAGILARMRAFHDPDVEVMGVSFHRNRFYLHINADFFRDPKHIQFLKGVLLHEVHHVVLGHLTHPKFRNLVHRDLLTLAQEMSANEHIHEPLPGRPIVWIDFADYGIRGGQSTLERYDLLVQARFEGEAVTSGDGTLVDDHIRFGLAEKGGFAGQSDQLKEIVADLIEQSRDAARDEQGNLPEARLAGQTPGQLLEQVRGTDEPPEKPLDWRTAIQMFAGTLRTPVHTYGRPNRRFPQLIGQVPGRLFYPSETDNPNLLVVIDTSGSMLPEQLQEIARQLIPLSKVANLTIVECDAVIQRTYPFTGQLDSFAGRGGTDLRPPFEREFYRPYRTSGIIYFTDGCGPFLTEDPGIKTLWVLIGQYPFPCIWGQQCRMHEMSAVGF